MSGKDQYKKMMQGNEHILMQDVRVVSHIQPGPAPATNITELLLPEDRGVVEYRQRVKEWTDRGWRIDIDALAADRSNRVYAIPGPARRSAGNWVTRQVPLVLGKEQAS